MHEAKGSGSARRRRAGRRLGLALSVPGFLGADQPPPCSCLAARGPERCAAFEGSATQGQNRRRGLFVRHRNQQGKKSFNSTGRQGNGRGRPLDGDRAEERYVKRMRGPFAGECWGAKRVRGWFWNVHPRLGLRDRWSPPGACCVGRRPTLVSSRIGPAEERATRAPGLSHCALRPGASGLRGPAPGLRVPSARRGRRSRRL